jgi:hypothetical protein
LYFFVLAVLLHYLGFSRGLIFYAAIPFFCRYAFASKKRLILYILIYFSGAILLTYIKFSEANILLFSNLIMRISSYQSLILYNFFDTGLFDNNISLTQDFFQSLPIIRQNFLSIDEANVFDEIFGSISGFAVIPEVRAVSYWGFGIKSFFDVFTFYLFFYVTIKLLIKFLKLPKEIVLLSMPIIIFFDSVTSVATIIQFYILTSAILFFSKYFNRLNYLRNGF